MEGVNEKTNGCGRRNEKHNQYEEHYKKRKEVVGISLIYLIGGTSYQKKETVSGSLGVKDDAASLDGIGDIQLFTEVLVDALVLQLQFIQYRGE